MRFQCKTLRDFTSCATYLERIYEISEYRETLSVFFWVQWKKRGGLAVFVVNILEDVVTFHPGVVNYPRKNITT